MQIKAQQDKAKIEQLKPLVTQKDPVEKWVKKTQVHLQNPND